MLSMLKPINPDTARALSTLPSMHDMWDLIERRCGMSRLPKNVAMDQWVGEESWGTEFVIYKDRKIVLVVHSAFDDYMNAEVPAEDGLEHAELIALVAEIAACLKSTY